MSLTSQPRGTFRKTTSVGKPRDNAPNVVPAGKNFADGTRAGDALRLEERQAPDKVKRFTREECLPLGRPAQRLGVGRTMQEFDRDKRFGRTTEKSQRAEDVMRDPYSEGLIDESTEQIYETNRREPLGKAPVLGVAPDKAQVMVHGKASHFDVSAKEVIFPIGQGPPTSAPATFGGSGSGPFGGSTTGPMRKPVRWEAGEQRSRGYDWSHAQVDIHSHRFGSRPKALDESAGACLKSVDEPSYDSLPKGLAQRRLLQGDAIGQARQRGSCPASVMDNSVARGVKTVTDDGGAAACLKGNPTEASKHDQALGRSQRYGFRNDVETAGRSFGVPSIRNDLKRPTFQKVTDFNNYGDGQNAASTVCPSKYAHLGVFEEDFAEPVTKEHMKALSDKIGLVDPDDQELFDAVWDAARARSQDGDHPSVSDFLQCLD